MTQTDSISHPLILGSTSRYRRELLQRLGLAFDVVAPEVDESPLPGETPLALAQRFALTGAVVVSTPQDVAMLDARQIRRGACHIGERVNP